MTATTRLIVLAAVLLGGELALATVTEEDVNDAYYHGTASTLESLRDAIDRSVPEGAYLAAYLDWRLGSLHVGSDNQEAADAALERGQATLESLVETAPEHADAWALLASTIGMRIGISPMTRGPRYAGPSSAAMDRAVDLAPNNPRVLLLDAIGELNTPALFGGSDTRAFDKLNRALEIFAATGSGDYRWGEADAYLWRGIASQRAGETGAAAADFERALAIEPRYGFAQHLLSNVGTD